MASEGAVSTQVFRIPQNADTLKDPQSVKIRIHQLYITAYLTVVFNVKQICNEMSCKSNKGNLFGPSHAWMCSITNIERRFAKRKSEVMIQDIAKKT